MIGLAAIEFSTSGPVLTLAGAAVAFYLSARAGSAALDPVGARPAGSAVAHWLPIAAVSISSIKEFPAASINIIFAASVATVTLVLGVTLLSGSPHQPQATIDPTRSRGLMMLLPVALLALLAGFRGRFTLVHASIFVVEGVVITMLWSGTSPVTEPAPPRVFVKLIVWIGLSLIGAIAAIAAVKGMSQRVPRLTSGVVAALMLAPALVLPMIGSALAMTHEDASAPDSMTAPPSLSPGMQSVMTMCIGCVLLNLCLLLPLTIVFRRIITPDDPLPYPMAVWRIDTVILIVMGVALVPIASGRWAPKRLEGLALVAAYALYMSASASMLTRQ